MIDVTDMSFSYKEGCDDIFKDYNLHIDRGEFVALIGESGSGKTTLLNLFLRDLVPTSGSIAVMDRDIVHMNAEEVVAYRRKIGTVFQDIKLLHDRTVYENLEFAGRILEMSKRDSINRLTSVLSMLGLTDLYGRKIDELSGGQQQKICFARALMGSPYLMLCDEPTGNLDPESSQEFVELVHMIHNRGITVVMATHDINLVSQFSDCRIIPIDETTGGRDR